jgi:glycosyltransferase involved in cell wall biosynthesis
MILICHEHFRPAYKAGGIAQSLFNLKQELDKHDRVEVITSRMDLDGTRLDLRAYLPGVSYVSSLRVFVEVIRRLRSGVDCLYLNGLFSPFFFLYPLFIARVFFPGLRVVIAPRGMLQKGALAQKTIKKKVYLRTLTRSHLLHGVVWHATDKQELNDIQVLLGTKTESYLVGNIPVAPLSELKILKKSTKTLRLVYLGIITPTKNLNVILEALQLVQFGVRFEIVGPVKDQAYWQECRKLMDALPPWVEVHCPGSLSPDRIQDCLSSQHALILPSKGENFGHAIYEALSVGRPVIISHHTPWQDLRQRFIGWNVECKPEAVHEALNELNGLSDDEYAGMCFHAHRASMDYYRTAFDNPAYLHLFGIHGRSPLPKT